MKSQALILAVLLACLGRAYAEDIRGLDALAGTLDVIAKPFLTEGKLTGCTLEYRVLHLDFAYRQGRPIRVDGNVAVMSMRGTVGVTLKVVVNEMRFDALACPRMVVRGKS